MAYTFAQLEAFALAGGFPPNVAPIMAAIAFPESGGRADAVQQGQPYSTTGWGLWQITPGNSEPQFGTDQQLLNPINNARAAHAKWVSQGLGAWTTYTSGAYKKYLQSGVAPDAAGAAQGAADALTQNLGSGIPGLPDPTKMITDGITAGVGAIFGPFTKTIEHVFDVTMNNVTYILLIAAGVGIMGVGVVLMVKETPVGNAITQVAKVVTP